MKLFSLVIAMGVFYGCGQTNTLSDVKEASLLWQSLERYYDEAVMPDVSAFPLDRALRGEEAKLGNFSSIFDFPAINNPAMQVVASSIPDSASNTTLYVGDFKTFFRPHGNVSYEDALVLLNEEVQLGILTEIVADEDQNALVYTRKPRGTDCGSIVHYRQHPGEAGSEPFIVGKRVHNASRSDCSSSIEGFQSDQVIGRFKLYNE